MPAITTTNTEYATTRCRCNGIGSSIGSSTVVAADVSISYSNNYNDYYYMVGSISSDGVGGVAERSVATLLLLQQQQHTTINRGGWYIIHRLEWVRVSTIFIFNYALLWY